MTTTPTTTDDFRATKSFNAAPDVVFSALTDIDALTRWWTPAAGGTLAGETLRFLVGDLEVVMRVDEADRASRVRWSVIVCEPVPDWAGTAITFDLTPTDDGTELHFRHHGLNPSLECFDMCNAGWTRHLARLVEYVDRGTSNPVEPAERFVAWRAEHNGN
jgi:uncharacterized protein YndB with AHSA1/START domain